MGLRAHLRRVTGDGASGGVDPRFRRARLADATVFLVLGAAFGTWAVRIPAIQRALSLTEGAVGLALLGLAAGSIVGLVASGVLVGRVGARRLIRVGLVVYCLALPALAHAGGLTALVGGLAVFGAGKGLMDTAANTQGLRVERAYPKSIMGSFHALFSGGGLVGSAVGALAINVGLGVRTHFALVGVALLCVGLLTSRWLLPASAETSTGPSVALPSRRLLGFCLIGFCALFLEGVANDWSAIYLESGAGASATVAALGFAVFSLTMTVGRFVSDRVVDALGSRRFLRATAVVAAAGLALTLTAAPLPTLCGFALLGVGLAGMMPVAVSMAGRADPDTPTGSAVAAVSTTGYGGFAVGPVAIGLVADATSLRAAFVPALAFAVAVLAVSFALPAPGE
ncbi:MFS transporter (plasmid) [Halarchaeum sp. CBA1220]|uniref:MFS transporter n=1 Tax=Halarchaeum sp. CBA1220 TaxID=1853682 RepID=UPI000F3A96BE|nr:MFS transporter [Halarchaeum sp. CBA1220]QLC35173.1 MFS transporter [Halarchaeum sp. CBA1220]